LRAFEKRDLGKRSLKKWADESHGLTMAEWAAGGFFETACRARFPQR
jgi:hypothetical protein